MIGDTGKDVGEPCLRVDAVHFCCRDQAVHRCSALTAAVRAGKEPIAAPKLPLTEGGFMIYEFIPVGPLSPLGRLIRNT